MKYYSIIAAMLVSFLCLTAPVMVKAADAEATQTLTGLLTTENNDEDAVVKAVLTVGETTYYVVLDAVGKELASKMNDKKVEVTAVVAKKEVEVKDDNDNTVKETQLWLTIKSFKPVAEEAGDSSDE
jgi:hypothetical protein